MTRPRVFLFFLLLGLVFGWPWWSQGMCLYPGSNLGDFPLHFDGLTTARNYDLLDSIAQAYPSELLFQQELRSGHLPLWNPYTMLGVPLYQGQANYYFYPPLVLLHMVVSVERVHDLLTLSHLVLAGWGMVFFLRGQGYSSRACLWGGLVWAWNGYLTSNLQFQGLLISLSWFPVLLGLIQRRRWWTATLVAGLGVGAGPLNVVWIAWAVAGFWAASLRLRPLPVLGTLVGAILLTAAQTLPTLLMIGQSVRAAGDSSLQMANCQRFLGQSLLGFWVPDAWGNPAMGYHLQRLDGGQWFYFETCCYLGIAPGILALLGFLRRPQAREGFWLALLGLQVLCLATPVYLALAQLPLLGSVASLRTLPFAVLVLTVLSVRGFEELEVTPRRFRLLALALFLLVAGALTLWLAHPPSGAVRIPFPERGIEAARLQAQHFFRWHNASFWVPLAQFAGLTLLAWLPLSARWRSWVLFFWASADLVFFAAKYNPWDDPARLRGRTLAVEILQRASLEHRVMGQGTIRPNLASAFQIRELSGYGSLLPGRQTLLLSGLRQAPSRFEAIPIQLFPLENPDPILLNLLSVSHLACYPGVAGPAGWEALNSHPIPIYRNPSPTPLARFVSAPRLIDSRSDAAVHLRHWLMRPDQATIAGPPQPEGPGGACKILQWSAGRIRLLIEPGSWGWLVVGEGYFPGWRARLDGREASVYAANVAQMAIYLPPGCRQVELEFWPQGLSLGLTLSGMVALICCLQLARGRG